MASTSTIHTHSLTCTKIIKFLLLTLEVYTQHTRHADQPYQPPKPPTNHPKSIPALYLPINKAVLAYDNDNHILTHILRWKWTCGRPTTDDPLPLLYIVLAHLVPHMRLRGLTTWPNMQTANERPMGFTLQNGLRRSRMLRMLLARSSSTTFATY